MSPPSMPPNDLRQFIALDLLCAMLTNPQTNPTNPSLVSTAVKLSEELLEAIIPED